MKKRYILLVLAIYPLFLQAQIFEWAKNGQGFLDEQRISTDKNGNSFVCGTFYGKCIFDEDTIDGNGSDIFLAKYDSSGNVEWLIKIGGSDDDIAGDIATDNSGYAYLTGSYEGSITIGNTTLSGDGTFLAKFNSTGIPSWAIAISTSGIADYLVTGNAGVLFIAGETYSSVNVGCGVNISGHWVARFDTAGGCKWVVPITTSDIMGLTSDHNDNSYITGSYSFTAIFGNISITSNGQHDIFLAKCDSTGNWLWAKSYGGNDFDQGHALDTDPQGNVFLTGYFRSTVNFECDTLTSTGSADIFVLKVNSNGECLWVQQAGGGGGNQYGDALCTDLHGNCFISGFFLDTAYFCSTTLIPVVQNFYAAAYSYGGNCAWAVQSSGPSSGGERGVDMDCDGNGNIYICGTFFTSGVVSFGSINLLAKDDWMFTTKLSSLFTGVTESQLENHIKIYPMPVITSATIETNDKSFAGSTFILYSAPGVPVRTEILSGKSTKFSRGNLREGMYFYEIRNNNKVFSRGKIIIATND